MSCFLPLPYGFYTIIRIVTTILSCLLAYHYYSSNKVVLAVIFGIIALIFQPLIKFAIGRDAWLVVDGVVAALLVILAIKDLIIIKSDDE